MRTPLFIFLTLADFDGVIGRILTIIVGFVSSYSLSKSKKCLDRHCLLKGYRCLYDNEVEPREIMAFGEHLRADQNVDFVVGDAAVQIRPIVFVRGAVPIDADDGGLGQEGAQGFFDALRAVSDGGQVVGCRSRGI